MMRVEATNFLVSTITKFLVGSAKFLISAIKFGSADQKIGNGVQKLGSADQKFVCLKPHHFLVGLTKNGGSPAKILR